MTLVFKTSPVRGGLYIHQSPWIYDVYNHFFKEKHDGYLVELGVGHVLDWQSMGYRPQLMNSEEYSRLAVRGWSNTIELIENGWSGIYVDPMEELIENELKPLIGSLIPQERLKDVKMICCGASDDNYIAKVVDCETINIVEKDTEQQLPPIEIPYIWKNRLVKCRKTSDILSELNCPEHIDVMSIDVEGHELHAIRGLNFNLHKPKLMIVETDKATKEEVQAILPSNYKLIAFDYLNSVFLAE